MLLMSVLAPSALAQIPAAPTVIYAEDFENGVGATPILLTDYVGASGETYTADPAWLTACNGAIVEFSSPDADQVASGCGAASSYGRVRQLAYALGVHRGSPTPATNHAVTAYTENPAPGPDRIQFETESPIPLVTSGRFITFSVDATEVNCHANHALFKFYLLDGALEIPTFTTPIDPCTDPGAQTIAVPARGSAAATSARTGTYAGNSAVLFQGSQLGIRMRNGQGSSGGNDAAFDNIRMLDVTPRLEKSFSPAALNVGQPSALTFTIVNTSELAAKSGWSFTDNLLAGLVVADPAGASTTCSGGSVTAAAGSGSVAVAGNLDAGQVSCTVSVNVTSSSPGTYANCPGNFTTVGIDPPACATVQFRQADLDIAKSAAPSPIVPGEEATFELRVTNKGPDEAIGMTVSDVLPAGFSLTSASPECSEAGGTLTCTVASLAAGASQTFTVTGGVDSTVEHCLENTATVSSATFDPNLSDNTATICAPIEGRVDLSITKTPSATALPIGGGQVIYTLVIENDGPSDATGVKVTDPMAAGLTLVSAEPAQGTCATANNTVSCDLGRLAVGGSTQLLVTANTSATAGEITNTATVRADQVETDPENNQDSATVSVPPGPPPPTPPPTAFDLEVDKRVNVRWPYVGQRVTYRIVVRNNGPDTAPQATLTDTYNARATVVSVRTPQGSCTRRMPITCELGPIEAGASVTIRVVIRPRETGRARNAASATSCCGTDSDPSNNMDTVDIRVRKVKLRLSKVASRSSVAAGERFSYRIRVRNPTRGQARRVRVCDRLPSGLRFVSAKPRAQRQGRQRCWTIRRLGARKTKTFRVTVRAARGANGRVNNRATASSPDARARVRAQHRVRVRGVATPVTG